MFPFTSTHSARGIVDGVEANEETQQKKENELQFAYFDKNRTSVAHTNQSVESMLKEIQRDTHSA